VAGVGEQLDDVSGVEEGLCQSFYLLPGGALWLRRRDLIHHLWLGEAGRLSGEAVRRGQLLEKSPRIGGSDLPAAAHQPVQSFLGRPNLSRPLLPHHFQGLEGMVPPGTTGGQHRHLPRRRGVGQSLGPDATPPADGVLQLLTAPRKGLDLVTGKISS